ncbi:MAG: isoprenyl transferase [Flavobacterium sp.]|jgi:undecaprenyl diphosphate synthase
MNLEDQIQKDNLPQHVAIIMDGNGRWAKQRGFMRIFGHENGSESVRTTIETCGKLGIKYLTLYAFSTENWNRPQKEVDALMNLLVDALQKELKSLMKNDIKLNVIGDISKLPAKAQKKLTEVLEISKNNKSMTVTLALSYGAREELVNSVKEIIKKVKNNIINENDINELIINEHLYTHNLPDVDLLIRTSGEQRISNFLLWQIAYAELYFTSVLWPDFKQKELYEAIISYQKRERRFGKTSEQL